MDPFKALAGTHASPRLTGQGAKGIHGGNKGSLVAHPTAIIPIISAVIVAYKNDFTTLMVRDNESFSWHP